MRTVAVPAWPIITLHWEGEVLLVSDSDASLELRKVLPLPGEDPFETSRRAAVKACKSLQMARARVEGIDGAHVLSLIVDAGEETLTPAHAPATAASASRTGTALHGLRSRAEASRFAPALLPLLGAVAVVADLGARASRKLAWVKTRQGRRALTAVAVVACLVATAGVVGAQRTGWFTADTRRVQAAVPAPAGQLPVYAPAGWQTFAAWTVPVTRTNIAPVLSPDGNQVITLTGGRLEALDARTGAMTWSTGVQGAVSALRVMAVDGEQKIVLTDGATVRLFALDGAPGPVYETGDVAARPVTDTGREAYFTLPDQKAMVLTRGGMSLRRIPAGAVPVGVDRGALLAVEVSTAKLWRITDDTASFPAPVSIPAPKDAKKLTAVYTAPDGSLVTVWAAAPDKAVVAVYPVFPALAAPVLVTTVPASSAAATSAVVDRPSATVLVGRVLIDTRARRAVEVPGASGKLGAGYWWGSKDLDTVRVGTSGDVVSSPAEAPVPLFVLPDRRVLVEAGTDQSIYALAPLGENT